MDGGRVEGYAAGSGGTAFGVWASVSRIDLENDETLASFDGDIWQGFVGAEAILNDRFTVGLAAGFEDSDFDTDFNGGEVEADGWSLTPYASVRLNDHWTGSALVSYTDLDYDVSNALTGTTGDFNGDRWIAAAELKGAYRMDSINLRPVIGWSHAWDSQDSYTDSAGTRISGNNIDVGRIYAGGEVGYAAGIVEPYLTGRLKFDYDEPGNVPVSATSSTSYDEFTAEVGVGLNIDLGDSLIFNLQGTYDSLGADDIDAWRAEGKIKLRF